MTEMFILHKNVKEESNYAKILIGIKCGIHHKRLIFGLMEETKEM